MAQKKETKNKEKELFTICIKVTDDGKKYSTHVTLQKDGKENDFRLLDGDNLYPAFESIQQAAGFIGRMYVEHLHDTGRISDEEYQDTIKGKKVKK